MLEKCSMFNETDYQLYLEILLGISSKKGSTVKAEPF
jgi:hypothetical protein